MKKIAVSILSAILFAALTVPVAAAAETSDTADDCRSWYTADFFSGTVIDAKNETEHLPIASVCKVMTMLLCFEEADAGRLSFDEKITASETASGMGGSQVFLEAGAVYTADDLIKSICIASANDACVAMAERIGGSEGGFVQKMNARAKDLNMNDTVFVNCTGLPEAGQYSCAKDVAKMFSALLGHDAYFRYSKIWMDKISHPKGRETEMANTNKLLKSYNGCDAGKTGFTNDAGFCLAASAERGNMRIVSVVLGAKSSQDRFDRVKKSFDNAFANYSNRVIFDAATPLDERCPVVGGKKSDAAVKPERSSYVFSAKNDSDEIFYEVEFDIVKAPLREGDKVGTAIVYKNNVEADRVVLVSNENVKKVSYFDSIRKAAENWII